MSELEDFNRIECEKIDANCIDAFDKAYLDEEDPTILHTESSWGHSKVNLTPAVKAAETLTSLYLSPQPDPNCLVYEPERGDNDCIHGDELSRIISMQKLKDVDQNTPIGDGDVYEFDENIGKFTPFGLKSFVQEVRDALKEIRQRLSSLEGRVSTVETIVKDHENRIKVIEEKIAPPAGAPSDARIVHGNINLYSDHNAQISDSGEVQSLNKNKGFYGHSLNTSVSEDEVMG